MVGGAVPIRHRRITTDHMSLTVVANKFSITCNRIQWVLGVAIRVVVGGSRRSWLHIMMDRLTIMLHEKE